MRTAGEHPEELNGHVSETANTENDNCAVCTEVGQRSFYRVVRRQRGVAQRSGFGWTHVTQQNQQSYGGNQHVFRHPTVQA